MEMGSSPALKIPPLLYDKIYYARELQFMVQWEQQWQMP